MNILEEIKVRWCSDNLLDNGGFEILDSGSNVFENWDESIPAGGSISSGLGYKGNKCAKLTGEGAARSRLTQSININNIVNRDFIISFAGKNSSSDNGRYEIWQTVQGSIWELKASGNITSNNWEIIYNSVTIGSDITLLKIKLFSPQEANATSYDDIKIYYIDEQEIDIDLIEDKSLSNIKQEIEDDLFTFKGDNFNFKIRNNHNELGEYFDNQRFTTDDKLFSLCIKFNLFHNGDTVNRFLTYFVDRKSCGRDVNYDKDIINISAFELSGLIQDKGWFIGKYIYEVPATGTKVTLTTPSGILETGDWSIIQVGNDLVFMYKGAEKYRIEI